MKLFTVTLAIAVAFIALYSTSATARSDIKKFLIKEAIESPAAYRAGLPKVEYYFAGQKHPAVARDLGIFKSNQKTNAFNKSDVEACEWTFLSSLKSLLARVNKERGDAIIEIRSVTKDMVFESATEYQCVVGALVSHVALEGRVVTFK
jgi:hypothetical protein